MALIQVDGTELDVSEDVLSRVVAAHDGIRRPNGAIAARSGWMTVTDANTGEEIYVQTLPLGYVREN